MMACPIGFKLRSLALQPLSHRPHCLRANSMFLIRSPSLLRGRGSVPVACGEWLIARWHHFKCKRHSVRRGDGCRDFQPLLSRRWIR